MWRFFVFPTAGRKPCRKQSCLFDRKLSLPKPLPVLFLSAWLPRRIEAMTSVTGSIRAAAMAAILTAAPAWALAPCPPAQNFCGLQETLPNAVYAYELSDEGYTPFYDDENYCWQQVWTANGWRWVDICYGYAY
jgi:hypothetical protein